MAKTGVAAVTRHFDSGGMRHNSPGFLDQCASEFIAGVGQPPGRFWKPRKLLKNGLGQSSCQVRNPPGAFCRSKSGQDDSVPVPYSGERERNRERILTSSAIHDPEARCGSQLFAYRAITSKCEVLPKRVEIRHEFSSKGGPSGHCTAYRE